MRRVYLALGLLLLPGMSWAQESQKENEFTMSMQIRPRAEYRNGSLFPRNEGDEAASFINNRARLSMEYKRSDLSMKISAQHVGVWGQDPQIDTNGRFIMNEAWAKLNFGTGFFAQLGRQTLSYDDERILGGLDWNVAGRYHDALKLGYANKANQLHLILAFNQNKEKTKGGTYYHDGAQPYKNMQTLWYHYTADELPLDVSLLFLNLGLETGVAATETSHTRYLQTFGTYITYKPQSWDMQGAFYYQTGKNKSAQSVSAFMASVKAAYAFDKQWSVSLGYDYLSGNGGKGDKFKAFDPLYGTHHKFYGAMDYFYATAWQGAAPGLQDAQLGVNFKTSKKVSMQLNYHYFATAAKLDDVKKGLGSEVDYQLDWNVMKDVKLSAGYSFMLGTKSMDIVKGGDHKRWQDWGWVSLNINPRILFVKW
ncbi:alginate export family protein [uncultured Bacteroides sp.]|uniref:alginate export family protein n=1 Tax=uncultured Bacteroides sp. TaxID=162156 RepID=UPI0025F7FD99|nr:alginate export family protein [uncultured Bacteroides sp.]